MSGNSSNTAAVDGRVGDALARAALQASEEGLEDAVDVGEALFEAPLSTGIAVGVATALFVLAPGGVALIGALHLMGAASRGIVRKRRAAQAR